MAFILLVEALCSFVCCCFTSLQHRWSYYDAYRLYSAAPLRDQSTNTINWYPTQSHYPQTEPTYTIAMSVHCHTSVPNLIWLSMWPGYKTPITNRPTYKQVYLHKDGRWIIRIHTHADFILTPQRHTMTWYPSDATERTFLTLS